MELNYLDFSIFEGGWSYTQKEVYNAASLLPNQKTLSILEFGCGSSSIKLFELLSKKWIIQNYKAYESNNDYLLKDNRINCIKYEQSNIKNLLIGDDKYDLILIDGPNGVDRKYWYSKIVNNVKSGTIILIDDWCHYNEFETALIEDFGSKIFYEIIETKKEFDPNSDKNIGYKSWKIIKVL